LKIRLACGLTVSQLGFGCSGLMARLSRGESRRLLDTAFASGITHFDTARLYGYGEAENVLGAFMQSRRSAVTVTTKAGILPPGRSQLLSIARAAARRMAQLHPGIRRTLRRGAEHMTKPGQFDTVTIRKSIETSLRELRTDRIDVLLLHDCTMDDIADPALASCLEHFRSEGKVSHIGIATDVATALHAQKHRADLAQIVQVANNPWAVSVDAGWSAGTSLFTHSPMGSRFLALVDQFDRDPGALQRWQDVLGFDPRERSRLADAFLRASLAANPDGCVLFSSQRAENIARNAHSAADPAMWGALRMLVADLAEPMAS
jgi:aryl-alcohol dehydrogenase-like predicted oxidoreductase